MAKPDIFLGQDETTVVKRLDIGVDRETSPDIELIPQTANIHLGGGGGNNSEGDVKLLDKDGNSRVQITAGGGKEENSNNVLIDGQEASIIVGSIENAGSIELWGQGFGGGGATMDAEGNLTLGANGVDGVVELLRNHRYMDDGNTVQGVDPAITLDADAATATVGGAGAQGKVNLKNSAGATTAEVRGDRGQIVTGGKGTAGSVLLKNEQSRPVGFFKASGDDVVFTAVDSGGDETVAMRIRPNGTVEFPQGDP